MTDLINEFSFLPERTKQILKDFTLTFKNKGFECYLVGGSCRDLLLRETPHDFDFATNCPIDEIKNLFKRVITYGEKHGTLLINFNALSFEVTLYRNLSSTKAEKSIFTVANTIQDDLQFRDLTLNAIAFDIVDNRVIDTQGGLTDFNKKIIRFVGSAADRIIEDQIRAIRYLRTILKLKPRGFQYDDQELLTVTNIFDDTKLNFERIIGEIRKIFLFENLDVDFAAENLSKMNVFRRFFFNLSEQKRILSRMFTIKNILPLCVKYRKNHSKKELLSDLKVTKVEVELAELVFKYGNENLNEARIVKNILAESGNKRIKKIIQVFKDFSDIDLTDRIEKIILAGEPYKIAHLDIGGNDLVELGYQKEKINKILKFAINLVRENPELNIKSDLIRIISSNF